MSPMPPPPMPPPALGGAAPAMEPSAAAMNEVCLPAASLEAGDNQGMETPAVGDPVEFSATGTVFRIEGDNVYLTLESVNGEPIAADAGAKPDAGEPNESDLLAQAQQVDQNPEY